MWTHADAALDSMGDAVLCTDEAAKIAYLNHAAEALTGWPRAVASGRPVHDVLRIVDGDTQQPVPDPLALAAERDQTIELAPNCALIQRDGRKVPIEGTAAPIHDDNGVVIGTVVTVRDVGAAREKSRELLHRARLDALTRLPNRALLNDSLSTAIAFARRHRKALAVGFLDVDGLKAVNDLHGHGAGDRILSGVASRIRATLRQSDSVGRVGGDEFVIVLSEIAHAEDAALVGEKLLQAIAAPYRVAGRNVTATASLGLALYPDDGLTAEDLVANADAAMYAAKRNGRGECRFFETNMRFASTGHSASVNGNRAG